MNLQIFLLAVLPLFVFVIIDAIYGAQQALKGAIIGAIFEIVLGLFMFGEIDEVSIISFLLVVVLAGISYYKKDTIHFKFQPVILGVVMGLFFLISFYLGHPLLLLFVEKYQGSLPLQMRGVMGNPVFIEFLRLASHYLGYGMIIHALCIAWAALKASNWVWLTVRFLGQFVMIFVVGFMIRLQLSL